MWKSLIVFYIFCCSLTQSIGSFSKIFGGDVITHSVHPGVSNGNVDKKKLADVVVQTPSIYFGGTIIGDRHILTSAQAFVPKELCNEYDYSKIVAGILAVDQVQVFIEGICYSTGKNGNSCDESDRGRAVSIQSIYIPVTYIRSNCKGGDLALLELTEVVGDHGVTLSDNKIVPISGDFILSGFGDDPNDTEHDSTKLMLKTVNLTAQRCKKFDVRDTFCTVEINKDACKSDGGAGLIDSNNVIYGVVKGGTACTTLYSSILNNEADELPLKEWNGGYFTAISYHLRFICEHVGMIKGCPETILKEPYYTKT